MQKIFLEKKQPDNNRTNAYLEADERQQAFDQIKMD